MSHYIMKISKKQHFLILSDFSEIPLHLQAHISDRTIIYRYAHLRVFSFFAES